MSVHPPPAGCGGVCVRADLSLSLAAGQHGQILGSVIVGGTNLAAAQVIGSARALVVTNPTPPATCD